MEFRFSKWNSIIWPKIFFFLLEETTALKLYLLRITSRITENRIFIYDKGIVIVDRKLYREQLEILYSTNNQDASASVDKILDLN